MPFSLSCACTKEENPDAFQIESYFCHEHSTNYKKGKVIKVPTDKIYQKLDIHVHFSGPVFKEVRKLTEGKETNENSLSIQIILLFEKYKAIQKLWKTHDLLILYEAPRLIKLCHFFPNKY